MTRFSLIIILFLALILRLINLNQSLWWDEAINVVYAQGSNFWWFVTKYPLGDFHPPGYFVILWIWGHLFNFSEISVRLPSIIFGVLTIYLTYLIGKELFGKKTGLVAALFLAVAPLHIYYSQEVRMYSLAAFAVSLSSYFLLKLLHGRHNFLWYAVSLGLVLYSDYTAYLVIPAHMTFVFLFHKQFLGRFLKGLAIGMMTIAPWIPIFMDQLSAGQEKAQVISGWAKVVGGTSIKEVMLLPIKIFIGRISFDNNLSYILLFIILASPFVLSFVKLFKAKTDSKTAFLWLWLIFPPVAAYLLSFLIPVFSYFRFIFILPAFYLLTTIGLLQYKVKISKILTILVVLSGLAASSIYLFNPKFHREDWRGAIGFVSKQFNNQTIAIFEYDEIPAPVRYYSKDLSMFRSLHSEKLETNLQNRSKVFLFEYLVDIYDPKRSVEQKLKNLNFTNTKTYDFRGVGFIKLYEN